MRADKYKKPGGDLSSRKKNLQMPRPPKRGLIDNAAAEQPAYQTRIALKSLTLVRVGPLTTSSPKALKKP